MGSGICFKCDSCGYEGDAMIGSGFAGPSPSFVPAHCLTCREVVTVDETTTPLACGSCGGTDVVLYQLDEETDEIETGVWQCPKCGKLEMRERRDLEHLCWD